MKALLHHFTRTVYLAVLYFLSAWFGLSFAIMAGIISSVWLPSGVAICYLLLGGWKNLPAIIIGIIAIQYYNDLSHTAVALITLGNTLEAAAGYLFLTKLMDFHPRLDRSRDVVSLACCAFLTPVFSATLGTIALGLLQADAHANLPVLWTTWWSGDVMGILVITPLILSWWKSRIEQLSPRKVIEILLLGAGLTVVCKIVFTTNFGGAVSDSTLAFLTFPFLLWAALRFGMRGAATASAMVALVAFQSVEAFSGPFRSLSINENVWLLQTFQAVSSLTVLIVAALISEKTTSNLALRNSELRLYETQKYESLGIMAGGIAHDFNNLLTAVLGNAEILQLRQKDNQLVAQHTGEIQKAAHKASALCQQMVAFSGCSIVANVAVDLNVWLQSHLKNITPSLPAGMRFQSMFSPDPLPANIHPEQLLQAIKNLLENAAEAYEEKVGIIELELGIRKINESNSRHNLPSLQVPPGNYVSLTVRDNGKGMPADIKDRIFEPFFTTKFTGRGLGLAFVLGIVRGHQGTLQVVSQPDKGTEITVLLPIHTTPEEKTQNNPVAQIKKTGVSYLMVDDDDLVREITVALLEETGARVFSASSGIDALGLYHAHSDEIDVALIDWIMPGMTGYEVARAIRAIKSSQAIILTSGFTNEEVSLDLPGEGKITFLPKPFTTKDILAKAHEVIG